MCRGLYGPRSQGAEAGRGESESGKEAEPVRSRGHSPGEPHSGWWGCVEGSRARELSLMRRTLCCPRIIAPEGAWAPGWLSQRLREPGAGRLRWGPGGDIGTRQAAAAVSGKERAGMKEAPQSCSKLRIIIPRGGYCTDEKYQGEASQRQAAERSALRRPLVLELCSCLKMPFND